MKLKTKFGKRIQQFFNNLNQIKIDRDNRKQFLIDIQQLQAQEDRRLLLVSFH